MVTAGLPSVWRYAPQGSSALYQLPPILVSYLRTKRLVRMCKAIVSPSPKILICEEPRESSDLLRNPPSNHSRNKQHVMLCKLGLQSLALPHCETIPIYCFEIQSAV
eukprot:2789848-Rhodomonas_salina.1